MVDSHYIVASKCITTPLTREIDHRSWLPYASGLSGKDFAKYRYDFLSAELEKENDSENDSENQIGQTQNIMLDYKGYDNSIDEWIIRAQYESIKNYFHYNSIKEQTQWHNFIDNMADTFINSKIVMPDHRRLELSKI